MIDLDNADDVVRLARYAYRRRSYPDDGPDTLLVLADLLDRVWELLWPTANVNRLSEVIANDSGNPPPLSLAISRLHNALKEIDPDRPRLAEGLRDLMAVTVKHLPGRRRGRAAD